MKAIGAGRACTRETRAASASIACWSSLAAVGGARSPVPHRRHRQAHHAAAAPRCCGDLVQLLASGQLNGAIVKTLGNAAIACRDGAGRRHGVGRRRCTGCRALRETLDPLFATYYAIPTLAFYPLLIVLFGLGDVPQIVIGFMQGVVAVIVSTLDGLDRVPRVLRKTARRATAWARSRRRGAITLPSAAPYMLTGAKLAVAYAIIGVIGGRIHHVARRHRLRDQLRLQQFRQCDDVSADPADPRVRDRGQRAAVPLGERGCCAGAACAHDIARRAGARKLRDARRSRSWSCGSCSISSPARWRCARRWRRAPIPAIDRDRGCSGRISPRR